MKKIVSLFQRNYDGDRLLRDEVVPGAEWVLAGEGVATLKVDGTCCMVRDGQLYKRYDAKKGRTPPVGWEPCEEHPNEHTGHWPGWLLVGDEPDSKYHREAWQERRATPPDGTYELIGPKVQSNPYALEFHILVPHGLPIVPEPPRSFDGLKEWLEMFYVEGIVWHHQDGRMCKVKRSDFGLEWPTKEKKYGFDAQRLLAWYWHGQGALLAWKQEQRA